MPTGGSGEPACIVGVTAGPPSDLCKRLPMCFQFKQAHDGLSGLGGSVSVHEILATFLSNVYATISDGPSRDLG